MSKRFLRFEQNGQPLVIEYDSIQAIYYDKHYAKWGVQLKQHSSGIMLEDDNAKRLLKHISGDCFDLFDKPESDI